MAASPQALIQIYADELAMWENTQQQLKDRHELQTRILGKTSEDSLVKIIEGQLLECVKAIPYWQNKLEDAKLSLKASPLGTTPPQPGNRSHTKHD